MIDSQSVEGAERGGACSTRRATEVAIATDVLNRMLELGHPEYVRIA
jgi:hypothetical protein